MLQKLIVLVELLELGGIKANMKKTTKSIIFILILLIAIFLGFFLFEKHKESQQSTLDIYVTPLDSKITLNGVKFGNSTKHNIAPGQYKVEISSENHKSESFEITIKPKSTEKLFKSLEKINGESMTEEESIVASGVETRKIVDQTQKMAEKYPILLKLPYRDTNPKERFRIIPIVENSTLTHIEIIINDSCSSDLYEIYKQDALLKLNEIEQNISQKYKITFISSCSTNN